MINRINLILRAKNITAKQFAEEIGIQPSGMSHILSGRNNPSLEFVSKVIRRYPEIDANWLLLGKGQMYASGAIESPAVSEPTLFVPPASSSVPVYTPVPELEFADEPMEVEREEIREAEKLQVLQDFANAEREQEKGEEKKEEPAPVVDKGRRLVKILFCYDDRTFEEYSPL
ncbi:MAG: helix-turn-helix domain-containing protein [bacterium]